MKLYVKQTIIVDIFLRFQKSPYHLHYLKAVGQLLVDNPGPLADSEVGAGLGVQILQRLPVPIKVRRV